MARIVRSCVKPSLEAGLVTFTPCGRWWVYPVRADVEELHHLVACVNQRIACCSCPDRRHAASRPLGRGTAARLD